MVTATKRCLLLLLLVAPVAAAPAPQSRPGASLFEIAPPRDNDDWEADIDAVLARFEPRRR